MKIPSALLGLGEHRSWPLYTLLHQRWSKIPASFSASIPWRTALTMSLDRLWLLILLATISFSHTLFEHAGSFLRMEAAAMYTWTGMAPRVRHLRPIRARLKLEGSGSDLVGLWQKLVARFWPVAISSLQTISDRVSVQWGDAMLANDPEAVKVRIWDLGDSFWALHLSACWNCFFGYLGRRLPSIQRIILRGVGKVGQTTSGYLDRRLPSIRRIYLRGTMVDRTIGTVLHSPDSVWCLIKCLIASLRTLASFYIYMLFFFLWLLLIKWLIITLKKKKTSLITDEGLSILVIRVNVHDVVCINLYDLYS
ncbi:hypothetical protein RchiOBHm_Chr5g0046441 [Rosa chinensis]|uniref:Uncharacterized protein n=1 Tax=Rosa chinensis TaxID=74649 RepID=A0A2P6QE31_ROSCH|nr:hypothetical protein RchiOBHm_Chr5g0046441 [Rosa chinensis]